jgi:hypothetical protein
LSPEIVIVSGDKSTLIMRPVFGEYYSGNSKGIETIVRMTLFNLLLAVRPLIKKGVA